METTLGCIAMPLVPGRKEPSDKSEMVTQLLFGESYVVLEEQKKWVLIKNDADGYECWIDRKQHEPLSEKPSLKQIIASPVSALKKNGSKLLVPMGAQVESGEFKIGSTNFHYVENESEKVLSPITLCRALLGAPYLWGGKSILGIDCSGLVQVVFSACGIQLPRDAYQQAEHGQTVDFAETALSGDIAYFDNEEGQITHVGILTGDGKIIHASGSVRIDDFDHQGIFNRETKAYTHKLRIIKRVIAQS